MYRPYLFKKRMHQSSHPLKRFVIWHHKDDPYCFRLTGIPVIAVKFLILAPDSGCLRVDVFLPFICHDLVAGISGVCPFLWTPLPYNSFLFHAGVQILFRGKIEVDRIPDACLFKGVLELF